MAATSPYTPNDYTAVSNFRPYELPINDIFKGIDAQSRFWDAGAAKVKSVYDTALNLKLSLEPNKEIRKKYMEDAEKQLTKLSMMDVADPSVQKQGFALFKPLFQDEGIIYDDLTTRHYEKVRNDALSFRGKDNGKNYSDINFQYAMQGYNEFLNSKDRMAGKGFYESRKEYTPYYDYTEDFQKALKDCKPSSIETQSPHYGSGNAITGYMYENYSKELSAAQVRGCLEGGLSPNGQRQLQIEGAVGYKNNLPTLAADTSTYLNGVGKNLGIQLQQLSAKKLALKDKKDISQADKQAMDLQIDLEMKATRDELDRTNNTNKKLVAGDYTDIQNNFDQYAGSVYSYKKILKKALSSSYEEQRRIYKGDPVQLNDIRFSQDKYLRYLDYSFDVSLKDMEMQHDKEMALIDLMYGGKGSAKGTGSGSDIFRHPITGEITLNPNLMRETGNLTDKPEINKKVYTELTDQASQLGEADRTNNLSLYNNFKNRAERDIPFRENMLKAFNYGTSDDEWARFKADHANNAFDTTGIQGTPWFKAYAAEKPEDEFIDKWSAENSVINTGVAVLDRKIKLGDAEVSKRLGGLNFDEQIQSGIKDIKPTALADGTQVTANDMAQAMGGKGGRLKIIRGQGSAPSLGGGFKGSVNDVVIGFELDGKVYKENPLDFGFKDTPYTRLRRFYTDVDRKVSGVTDKFNKMRVDVFNELGFNREPWYFATDPEKAPILDNIKALLGPDKEGKDLNVKLISSDFSGGIKVSIPGVKKGEDVGGVIAKLRGTSSGSGIGTSVEATGDGIVTIRGTTHNVIPQAINNPVLAQAAFQMASIGATPDFAQTQEGDRTQTANIELPAMIRGKQEKLTIETYKINGRPEYRVFVEGSTDPRAKVVASNAYELFEKLAHLPMDLKQPIK